MELIINSKFFAQYSVPELGEKAIELGYDGIDLCVREGHPIHVDNVIEALPKAAEIWRSQGLICPMITAPVNLIDPELTRNRKILYRLRRSRDSPSQNRILEISARR